MADVLLRPWLEGLRAAGYCLEIACSDSGRVKELQDAGFVCHVVPLSRSFNVFKHVGPFFQLVRLLRKSGYDGINAHSPVAAVLGRLAAAVVSVYPRVYFVHGFYFHENMPRLLRRLLIWLELICGRFTDGFLFVSDEDHRTAKAEGIIPASARSVTIWNGINLERFAPQGCSGEESDRIRAKLGVPPDAPIVCVVGRIVREKGFREFIDMAVCIGSERLDAHFLIVGSTLPSDRDQFSDTLMQLVRTSGIEDRVHFTGQVPDTAPYLRASSVFVLPSYREGFPRSIVEAMGCGLPTVTTNIRGCREAIKDGVTGFVVPVRDSVALAVKVRYLLQHPEVAREFGRRAREEAVALYDERIVQKRVVDFMDIVFERTGSATVHGGIGGPGLDG